MKKALAMLLCAMILFSLAGCSGQNQQQQQGKSQEAYTPVSGLNTDEKVTLKAAIVFETDKALDAVANEFMKKYPNVTVQLEYVEDYSNNAWKMLQNNAVDIILQRDINYTEVKEKNDTTNVETVYQVADYYYNFADDQEIDFSHTTQKLMGNYTHTVTDGSGSSRTYLYTVPVGGEVRGLFVNKTLLKTVGKEVPTNWTEFLDCCETLQQAGYIPIQGNPASAAAALMLASCVNGVVHDEKALGSMRQAEEGVSTLFEDSMRKQYQLAYHRYYDYKYVEEEFGQFKGVSDIAQARSFLGLVRNESTYEYETPENNYGTVAFFPYLSYLGVIINQLVGDYKLDTEVTFIPTPTQDEGNSPVYMTPYYGLCGNKNSQNLIWVREFVNFFFQTDMTKLYAEEAGIIPNTTDAMAYMAAKYGVDENTACSSCGDIYFSDSYNGYTPLASALLDTVKCGAQKYMVILDKDESGAIRYQKDEDGKEYLLTEGEKKIYREYVGEEDAARPGYAFCTFEYFMNQLENGFAKYRGA